MKMMKMDDDEEFGHGWDYNDNFDKPDEEDDSNDLDEDGQYVKGFPKDEN